MRLTRLGNGIIHAAELESVTRSKSPRNNRHQHAICDIMMVTPSLSLSLSLSLLLRQHPLNSGGRFLTMNTNFVFLIVCALLSIARVDLEDYNSGNAVEPQSACCGSAMH